MSFASTSYDYKARALPISTNKLEPVRPQNVSGAAHRSRPTESAKLRIPPVDTLFDDFQCPHYRPIPKRQIYELAARPKHKHVLLPQNLRDRWPEPHDLWASAIGEDWLTRSEHPVLVDVMDVPSISEFNALTL
jgi:hypothetical protein